MREECPVVYLRLLILYLRIKEKIYREDTVIIHLIR